jgi:hypothetical protein
MVSYSHKEELKNRSSNQQRYLKIINPTFKSIPLKGTYKEIKKMKLE